MGNSLTACVEYGTCAPAAGEGLRRAPNEVGACDVCACATPGLPTAGLERGASLRYDVLSPDGRHVLREGRGTVSRVLDDYHVEVSSPGREWVTLQLEHDVRGDLRAREVSRYSPARLGRYDGRDMFSRSRSRSRSRSPRRGSPMRGRSASRSPSPRLSPAGRRGSPIRTHRRYR